MKKLLLAFLSITLVLSVSLVFLGANSIDTVSSKLSDFLNDSTVKNETKASFESDNQIKNNKNDDSKDKNSLEATFEEHTVVVSGDLPKDAELSLTKVDMNTARKIATDLNKKEVVFACDIKIIDKNGNEWQPDESVKVSVSDLNVDDGEKLGFLHISEDLSDVAAQENKEEVVEDLSFADTTDSEASFETTGFSVFVGYTVDFHYGEKTFSIEGKSSVLLSTIFEELSINKDATKAIDVKFSDESLVTTEQQSNGDWLLTSLKAFTSKETLTITFEGEVLVIDVTDAITPVSETYLVTYSYGGYKELYYYDAPEFLSTILVNLHIAAKSSDSDEVRATTLSGINVNTFIKDATVTLNDNNKKLEMIDWDNKTGTTAQAYDINGNKKNYSYDVGNGTTAPYRTDCSNDKLIRATDIDDYFTSDKSITVEHTKLPNGKITITLCMTKKIHQTWSSNISPSFPVHKINGTEVSTKYFVKLTGNTFLTGGATIPNNVVVDIRTDKDVTYDNNTVELRKHRTNFFKGSMFIVNEGGSLSIRPMAEQETGSKKVTILISGESRFSNNPLINLKDDISDNTQIGKVNKIKQHLLTQVRVVESVW